MEGWVSATGVRRPTRRGQPRTDRGDARTRTRQARRVRRDACDPAVTDYRTGRLPGPGPAAAQAWRVLNAGAAGKGDALPAARSGDAAHVCRRGSGPLPAPTQRMGEDCGRNPCVRPAAPPGGTPPRPAGRRHRWADDDHAVRLRRAAAPPRSAPRGRAVRRLSDGSTALRSSGTPPGSGVAEGWGNRPAGGGCGSQRRSASTTAWAKVVGASCGRLWPMFATVRCWYGPLKWSR